MRAITLAALLTIVAGRTILRNKAHIIEKVRKVSLKCLSVATFIFLIGVAFDILWILLPRLMVFTLALTFAKPHH